MGNKNSGPASLGGRKQQQQLMQLQNASMRRMHERMRALAAQRQQELGEAAFSEEPMYRPGTPDSVATDDTQSDSDAPPPSMGGRSAYGGDTSGGAQTLQFDSREGKWKFSQ
jgi:hypothetical protein